MKKFKDFIDEKRGLVEKEGLKAEYEEVFKSLLDKYDAESPAELNDKDKVKFFEEIKKHYTAGKGQTKKGEELTKS
jgi:hypothetical protein